MDTVGIPDDNQMDTAGYTNDNQMSTWLTQDRIGKDRIGKESIKKYICPEPGKPAPDSVSYTHLDVYKRQVRRAGQE